MYRGCTHILRGPKFCFPFVSEKKKGGGGGREGIKTPKVYD